MILDEKTVETDESIFDLPNGTATRFASKYLERTFVRKRRRVKSPGTPVQRPSQGSFDGPVQAGAPGQLSGGSRRDVHADIKTLKKPLRQLHLDLGQNNFACQTCKLCGMTYAPGEENDERMHAAYHASLIQGVRFTGWQSERVVRHEDHSGRILLVLPSDSAAHLKKVKELSRLLEDQLGLVNGWLLSVPCKVYLYVAASKRVVGCAMIQAVSTAFRVMAEKDTRRSPGDSSACSPAPCEAPPAAHRADDAAASSPDQAAHGPTEQRSSGAENWVSLGPDAQPSSCTEAEGACQGLDCGGHGTLGCTGVRCEGSLGAANPKETVSAAGRASAPSKQLRAGVGRQPQQKLALLRVDESRAEDAACGVRVIWVSVEARMQGIASKLLDVARSTFVAGYVIPRQELAFSQPTEHGSRFAASYTGCSSFLVYK